MMDILMIIYRFLITPQKRLIHLLKVHILTILQLLLQVLIMMRLIRYSGRDISKLLKQVLIHFIQTVMTVVGYGLAQN